MNGRCGHARRTAPTARRPRETARGWSARCSTRSARPSRARPGSPARPAAARRPGRPGRPRSPPACSRRPRAACPTRHSRARRSRRRCSRPRRQGRAGGATNTSSRESRGRRSPAGRPPSIAQRKVASPVSIMAHLGHRPVLPNANGRPLSDRPRASCLCAKAQAVAGRGLRQVVVVIVVFVDHRQRFELVERRRARQRPLERGCALAPVVGFSLLARRPARRRC